MSTIGGFGFPTATAISSLTFEDCSPYEVRSSWVRLLMTTYLRAPGMAPEVRAFVRTCKVLAVPLSDFEHLIEDASNLDDPELSADDTPITGLPFPEVIVVLSAPFPIDDPDEPKYEYHRYMTAFMFRAGDPNLYAFMERHEANVDFAEAALEMMIQPLRAMRLKRAMRAIVAKMQPAHVVMPSAGQRHAWKKRKPGQAVAVPVHYYPVRVEPVTVTRKAEPLALETAEREARELSYRFDRRAHTRLLVRRGRELDAQTRQVLTLRGYDLFDAGAELPQAAVDLLVARGHKPPESGEWLAMKRASVRSTVVGDEGLPYVPSLRLLPRT